ncbi:bifunctional adenosylcobinamide kinase/adenosylcobinamide-phosphate guanylyltransferase, partial [Salmonella enterica subsp. enterica serovar Wilhelmsburg]
MWIFQENIFYRNIRVIAVCLNNRLSAAADEVWLVVSGIGVKIK